MAVREVSEVRAAVDGTETDADVKCSRRKARGRANVSFDADDTLRRVGDEPALAGAVTGTEIVALEVAVAAVAVAVAGLRESGEPVVGLDGERGVIAA